MITNEQSQQIQPTDTSSSSPVQESTVTNLKVTKMLANCDRNVKNTIDTVLCQQEMNSGRVIIMSDQITENKASIYAALWMLPIRFVTGWVFFSAGLRKFIPEKIDPDSAGWLGHKIAGFAPNAFLVGPMIDQVTQSQALTQFFIVSLGIMQIIAGAMILLGLFTRIASFATLAMSMAILFSAGWLGPDCLDEYNMNITFMATSMTLMLAGGGRYFGLDAILQRKYPNFTIGGFRLW
ncbi:TQO small subunit DoxD [Tepidibacillus marianensis]|uniref:TQO small subunit DoxD n=1 Tax=Tepidibacillus marianensis TaxID=3131995 RepID=UPI0030D2081C